MKCYEIPDSKDTGSTTQECGVLGATLQYSISYEKT